MRKPVVAANWKENKTVDEALFYAREIKDSAFSCDVIIAPPYLAIPEMSGELADSRICVAAQDIFYEDHGAYTGEISPVMIKPYCRYSIIGHSERRLFFGDSDAIVRKKLEAALRHGIVPILCVGEILEERKTSKTKEVIQRMLSILDGIDAGPSNLIIAYEPVWAISRGDPGHRAATPQDAQDAHAFIRQRLRAMFGDQADDFRIIYGGSVKPENAPEFESLPDVDGALVGSASLDVKSFRDIISAFDKDA